MTSDSKRGSREYGTAMAVLASGGLLLLVGFGLTWARALVPLVAGVDGATKVQDLTGRDLLPVAAASGWVALAGLAGIAATRSWGRSVVAAVILVAGVVGTLTVVAFAVRPTAFVESVTSSVSASMAPGWLVGLVGGLCTCWAAGWTLVRGRGWPGLGARYQRSTVARSPWDLQDIGQDPTDDLVE